MFKFNKYIDFERIFLDVNLDGITSFTDETKNNVVIFRRDLVLDLLSDIRCIELDYITTRIDYENECIFFVFVESSGSGSNTWVEIYFEYWYELGLVDNFKKITNSYKDD